MAAISQITFVVSEAVRSNTEQAPSQNAQILRDGDYMSMTFKCISLPTCFMMVVNRTLHCYIKSMKFQIAKRNLTMYMISRKAG